MDESFAAFTLKVQRAELCYAYPQRAKHAINDNFHSSLCLNH